MMSGNVHAKSTYPPNNFQIVVDESDQTNKQWVGDLRISRQAFLELISVDKSRAGIWFVCF
jgi:hypothetical protein